MILLIAGGTLGLCIAMAGAWVMQRLTSNGGWADVVWSFALGAAGVACSLIPIGDAPLSARQWLVAALSGLWGARLGIHILGRTWGGAEDLRYAQFRRDWGAAFERRMFGFLQIQALVAAFLAVSMLVAARNPRPIGPVDILGGLVLLAAIVGEAVADDQLRRFRQTGHGRVCDIGLWGWSRHPNYFFEWLGWVAYPLLAIDLSGAWPWGWFALTAPAFMYYLLVYVSGVPLLEEQMLRSRGDAFRDYQARVSKFIPLPPRNAS